MGMKKDQIIKTLIVISIITIVVLWISSWLIIARIYPDLTQRGLVGDTFGVINALFSGLALAGVIIAILLQSKELALQRKELEATRQEIRGQKEQLELQNQTLRKQNFETSFFNLFSSYRDIIKSLKIGYRRGDIIGNDVFKEIRYQWYNASETISNHQPDLSIHEMAQKSYEELPPIIKQPLDLYIQNIKCILEYVDYSEISSKPFYIRIISSQLTEYELIILFYFGLSKEGYSNIRNIANKYHMLKNIPLNHLFISDHQQYIKNGRIANR